MSNFTEAFLAALAGISAYYLLETLYYEVKSRLNGRRFIRYVEDLEDEVWDN